MQESDIKKKSAVTYDLFKRLDTGDFEYVYRGDFTQIITRKILSLVEFNIQKFVDSSSLQNRIYFVMVEGLQNITRHQDDVGNTVIENNNYAGIFTIRKKGDAYIITTGNTVSNDKVDILKQKLENVNGLNKEELKKLHKYVLTTGELSSKGGAGLGLIEMARRSGNKLLFDFEKIDSSCSYFYMQTKIQMQSDKNLQDIVDESSDDDTSIEFVKELSSVSREKKIFFSFNGSFNKSNILSLLSIVKGHVKASPVSKKMYYIMVEMLQNISKHGSNIHDFPDGVSGIFHIKLMDDGYVLTSGNYVENASIGAFKKRLRIINSLNQDELSEYFNKILLSQQTTDSRKTGLGFIDIRLKSKRKIGYDFIKINDNFSFFTLQTYIKKD